LVRYRQARSGATRIGGSRRGRLGVEGTVRVAWTGRKGSAWFGVFSTDPVRRGRQGIRRFVKARWGSAGKVWRCVAGSAKEWFAAVRLARSAKASRGFVECGRA